MPLSASRAGAPEAIIFDCDGVLVDSELLSCGAWLPVLARRGIVARLADIEPFIGKSDRAVVSHFAKVHGRNLDPHLFVERDQEYFARARGNLASFPGVRATLEEVRRRGIPMAVASSGSPKKIRFNLQEGGLEDVFGAVCSATEVAHGKPAPDLFLHAAARLGVSAPGCVVVEDSVFGIAGARRAGMTALGFTSSHPAEELSKAGAHRTFDDFPSLLSLLWPPA